MDIRRIIDNKEIIIKYQPIMSTHNKDFLGMEALVRGIDLEQEISPYHLFNKAIEENMVLELDKLCIMKAIEGFERFVRAHSQTLLFINIDASVIEYYIQYPYIEEQLLKYNISAKNIVLEINELPSSSLELLKEFSVKYKALGCLIALDDIGAGESNLDRIPLIMPNIMKIDKELIQGLKQSFFKRQVVGRIIQMATNLGAQIVIEGVESIEDIYRITEYGAHLIQGYLLGKPGHINEGFYENITTKKKSIMEMMYKYIREINGTRKVMRSYMKVIAKKLQVSLEKIGVEEYESEIYRKISAYEEIESVYVLDAHGKLITDTLFNYNMEMSSNNLLYTPCIRGNSVELEEYYTKIIYDGFKFWISSEYISMASGNKCYTYSSCFGSDDEKYIICIDFNSSNVNARAIN